MKGITTNKRIPGKHIAQFWDVRTKHNKIIGVFDTQQEAIKAREEFLINLNKYNGVVLPKKRELPKGIRLKPNKKGNNYSAEVCVAHGIHKIKTVTMYLGTFDTVEKAIEARKEFINKLY